MVLDGYATGKRKQEAGKSMCMRSKLQTEPDICYMINHSINPDDDLPLVLVTVPTGSNAFQMTWSTIPSAFLLYDKSGTIDQAGTSMSIHLIEIATIHVINHRWNQHGKIWFSSQKLNENDVHSYNQHGMVTGVTYVFWQ